MEKVTPSNLPRLARAWAEDYLKEHKELSLGQLDLLVNTIAHDYSTLHDAVKARVDATIDGINGWLADTGRLTRAAGRKAEEALERLTEGL